LSLPDYSLDHTLQGWPPHSTLHTVLSIPPENVNQVLLIRKLKGAKPRRVPVTAFASSLVDFYLKILLFETPLEDPITISLLHLLVVSEVII
jgi:hypothetical protein